MDATHNVPLIFLDPHPSLPPRALFAGLPLDPTTTFRFSLGCGAALWNHRSTTIQVFTKPYCEALNADATVVNLADWNEHFYVPF